jgi:hypothetical protein
LTTPQGDFLYRHVRSSWFFGYREMSVDGDLALVATPEKALLDLLVLSAGELTEDRLTELRLQELERLDPALLARIAEASGSTRLSRAAKRLGDLVLSDREEGIDL